MENRSSKLRTTLLGVIGVVVLVIAVVGVSFAAFSYSKAGEKVNTISTGVITMSYTEPTNGITITNALPLTDASGKALTGDGKVFDFTVAATITGNSVINYAITATRDSTSTLDDSSVKVYLTSSSDKTVDLAPILISGLDVTAANNASGAPTGQYVLKTGTIPSTMSTAYRLRMWVDAQHSEDNGSIVSKVYKLKVNVYGKATVQ